MNVLDVTGLCKSFGPRTILADVNFTVGEDEKVGLIGTNGSGKSSLFGILAGVEERDAGSIITRRGATIGYLPQEPWLDDTLTVAEAIEQGLRDMRRATEEFGRITGLLGSTAPADADKLLQRQGELATWIDHHGGWQTDHLVTELMTHLQLPRGDQPLATLSGGNRRRVALARLLLESPDLLLLDEPTNHLDADCTQWLQEYLVSYRGAVLLITHDRYFLDQVASRMLELEEGEIVSYRGGYSDYLYLREERLRLEARSRSRLLNLLRTETAWIERGAKARTTKQKARIDRYGELRDQCTFSDEREARLAFSSSEPLGGTVLELRGVAKGYAGRALFKEFTFRLRRGERVGIIGPNGCGKTTLIRLAVGEEIADAGEVVIGRKTRIAYFDQHRSSLVPEQTIYDFLGEGDYVVCGGVRRHKIGYLEEFLFPPGERMRPVGTLSGGEKSRLILARLMLEDANMLVFDEPTNDLDIPTLQLLDEALMRFPGSLFMVTHDRFFLDKVATGILAFEESGEVTFYEGNYSHYRELKARAAEARKELERKGRKESGRAAGVQKPKQGLTYAERLELQSLEEEIGVLEGRLAAVEAQLADPAGYAAATGGVVGLSDEYGQLQEELGARYGRWEALETKRSG